ncbi:MAG: prepilin-type N-terminal cleavage/methylation domain-containing protein [Desulfobacterales bacterium]|nr:prepilin-type N-terminal cleavage/methylation domain-containing protein [Desulfobacterales bacterium]
MSTYYKHTNQRLDNKGFTLTEMLIVLGVVVIAAGVAVPNLITWFNNTSVKSASRDLYSAMQQTRINAVSENSSAAIVFDTANNRYYLCSDAGADGIWDSANDLLGVGDNVIDKAVSLTNFERYQNRVQFGHGNATVAVGAGFDDEVTYVGPDNVLVISSQGIPNTSGYVYLENPNTGNSYAVGTLTSGLVRLLRWNGVAWE